MNNQLFVLINFIFFNLSITTKLNFQIIKLSKPQIQFYISQKQSQFLKSYFNPFQIKLYQFSLFDQKTLINNQNDKFLKQFERNTFEVEFKIKKGKRA